MHGPWRLDCFVCSSGDTLVNPHTACTAHIDVTLTISIGLAQRSIRLLKDYNRSSAVGALDQSPLAPRPCAPDNRIGFPWTTRFSTQNPTLRRGPSNQASTTSRNAVTPAALNLSWCDLASTWRAVRRVPKSFIALPVVRGRGNGPAIEKARSTGDVDVITS